MGESTLISPHGSESLRILLLEGREKEEELKKAKSLPALRLSSRETGDLIMLGIGGFTPLTGFMGEADWKGVCETMQLTSGVFWPIPITLSVDQNVADELNAGDEIALVFQEPMTSFSAHYTVGNQIIETIMLHQDVNKKEARARAIEGLRHVGVPQPERRIDDYAFQLSGGLRQRVMISMALSCDPRILIADEPTTALDVTTQAQILDLLRDLQEQTSMAIMLITHNMGVIAEMADDVVVMYLGREVEVGPVDNIFHAPKHPYTRALLRSIPSVLSAPRTKLPTLTGAVPHPYNRPAGCPFYPRCPDFMPGVCDLEEPNLLPVGDRHAVSCFLYHEAKA